MGKVYDTDVGTGIILDTGADLSTATKVAINALAPPNNSVVALPASVYETTKVRHIKTADTLNAEGNWILQAYVEFENDSYSGEEFTLRIWPSLKPQK